MTQILHKTPDDDISTDEQTSYKAIRPKRHSVIKYKLKNESTFREGVVKHVGKSRKNTIAGWKKKELL